MRRGLRNYFLSSAILFGAPAYADSIRINEFVTDPQQDFNGDGMVSPSDEYFELKNISSQTIDLSGWLFLLQDTTPSGLSLSGILNPGEYFVIQNPEGMQNNDGRIELYDYKNNLIHAVSYGSWDDGNIFDNWPNGNANGLHNESLSAFPEGSNYGVKTFATRGYANVPEPKTLFLTGVGLAGLLKRRK